MELGVTTLYMSSTEFCLSIRGCAGIGGGGPGGCLWNGGGGGGGGLWPPRGPRGGTFIGALIGGLVVVAPYKACRKDGIWAWPEK